MSRYPFRIFWSEEDTSYVAEAEDLKGCSAVGATPEEAAAELEVAEGAWLDVASDLRIPIPPPGPQYWTHPSVLALVGRRSDPVEVIQEQAREMVFSGMESGIKGPPFDPVLLARNRGISVIPSRDVGEARTIPLPNGGYRIEYNPEQPHARMRFSLAHELAHALFRDCGVTARYRHNPVEERPDSWQLESVCDAGAAELLMPVGTFPDLSGQTLSIERIMDLRLQYDVSAEAVLLRLVRLLREPIAVFVASSLKGAASDVFRIDYAVRSPAWEKWIPPGSSVRSATLAECRAVGHTAKSSEQWEITGEETLVECVGIAPYPGHREPRVAGFLRPPALAQIEPYAIQYLRGNALRPRGTGNRLIAHIVNDRTPVWGAGFGRSLAEKYPAVQTAFRELCRDRANLALGRVHVADVGNGIAVVHLVAQHGFGPSAKPRIRYDALAVCLEQLADIAITHSASVHMPRIGTGYAGGNWEVISELVREKLLAEGIRVTVYDLPV